MGPKKPRQKKNQTGAPLPDSAGETQSRNQQTESEVEVSGISDAKPNGYTAPAPASADAPQKERVVVTLDASGGLDLGSMRGKTKERLIEALKRSQSELLPALPTMPVKRWPDFAVRGLYGLLGAAETAAAAKKYPIEIAQAVFMFSDAEIKELMEPTQAVLAKHAGSLDRFQEEISLGLVLIQVHFAKLHNLKRFIAEYEASKPAPAPAPAPKSSEVDPIKVHEPPLPEGIQ